MHTYIIQSILHACLSSVSTVHWLWRFSNGTFVEVQTHTDIYAYICITDMHIGNCRMYCVGIPQQRLGMCSWRLIDWQTHAETEYTCTHMHAHTHILYARTHLCTHLFLGHVHSSDVALWSNELTENKTVPARPTAKVKDTAALDCFREHKTTSIVPGHQVQHSGRCTTHATQHNTTQCSTTWGSLA